MLAYFSLKAKLRRVHAGEESKVEEDTVDKISQILLNMENAMTLYYKAVVEQMTAFTDWACQNVEKKAKKINQRVADYFKFEGSIVNTCHLLSLFVCT